MRYDGVVFKPKLDVLYHHGILGQKWGVRNGPPYPLDPIAKAKAYGRDDEIRGIFNPKHAKSKSFHDSEVDFAKGAHNSVEEVWARPVGGGEYDYVSAAKVIRGDYGKNIFGQLIPETSEEAAYHVNPGYGETGTTNNCTRVAVSIEMRKRGHNVVAARSHHGSSAFEPETWFNGAHTKGYSSSEEMKRDLLRNGEGASGVLSGYYGDGLGSGDGGHALHWEVKDRRVTIQDGQDSTTYDGFDEAWNHYGFNKGACFATRLDDCEPNWDAMIEDSVIGVPSDLSRRWRQNGKIYDRF